MVNHRRRRTEPPTPIPPTANPNIRPSTPPHSTCWSLDWGERGQAGDVRRCPHGRIQVLIDPPPYASVQGPGARTWETLSPVFDYKRYRAAVAALDTAGENTNG